jgi:hypothetical protein
MLMKYDGEQKALWPQFYVTVAEQNVIAAEQNKKKTN